MAKRYGVVLGVTALLLLGTPLLAEDAPTATDRPAAAFQPKLERSSSLIGMEVKNTKGESLGKISDLILNKSLDRVQVAVLSFGGALGLGEKDVIIPFRAFKASQDHKHLVLDADKAKLEKAQAFDAKNAPDMNVQWFRQQRQLWGIGMHTDEYGTERTEVRVNAGGAKVEVRADDKDKDNGKVTGERADVTKFEYRQVSHIQGMKVHGRDNKEFGELKEVVIDLQRGRPVFAIVGYGDKLGPVPWTAVHVGFENKDIVHIDVDQTKLDAVAFQNDKWPNWNDRQSLTRIYEQFGEEPYWEVHGYVGEETARMTVEAWQEGSAYGKLYKKDAEVTLDGSVQSVGTFSPGGGAISGLRLRVKLAQAQPDLGGDVVTVHGGPMQYVQEQNFALKSGDQVKIVGAKVTVGNRTALIARQITKGDQTLTLRDENGKPKWDINKLRQDVDRYNSEQPGATGSPTERPGEPVTPR